MRLIITVLLLFMIISCQTSFNQNNELYVPNNFQDAFNKKTRSESGKPGEKYWQNSADYDIKIELEPASRLLKGEEIIMYYNNSPDTLDFLFIHLFANYYKAGNTRDNPIVSTDATEGVKIRSIRNLSNHASTPKSYYQGNNLKSYLKKTVLPGDSIQLEIFWEYTINEKSHNRTGMVDKSSFFIAYFFPRIAVYDDIDGWNEFDYTGLVEFYNDFGNYNVTISVPKNYVVWATGLLQNPDEVLKKKYAERYKNSFSRETITPIVNQIHELDKVTKNNEINNWDFKAENVTDFAFGTSDHYFWDAVSVEVDSVSGGKVLVEAAYNPSSNDFYRVADIAQKSIKYMSYELPGVSFPFPTITVFNGLSEMEYPMMVNDHSLEELKETIKLTSHEIFHSYFPFYMGFNETKYAWMDEGWATFGDYLIASTIDSTIIGEIFFTDVYTKYAGTDWDAPAITNSDILRSPTYWLNSYTKPALFLYILKNELGDEEFKTWIQEFIKRWNGKHPTPYDYFNTLNHVVNENMNWLIKPWFFNFAYIDIEISKTDKNEIIIQNPGGIPVCFQVEIEYKNDTKTIEEYKASVWKDNNTVLLKFENLNSVKQIEIKKSIIPETNYSNNKILFE